MAPLRNSDVAAVSDGEKIHVFYQGEDGKIHESTSTDGHHWSEDSTLADGELSGTSSALTAFYCHNDRTNDNKPSIHVLYINNQSPVQLVEQVKAIGTKSWKKLKFPSGIEEPINTSKLASGVCHDGSSSQESHHWVYFTNLDKGVEQIKELRKGGNGEWKNFKNLPEDYGTALPGTAFGCALTNPTTFLQVQVHDLNIWQFEGGYDTWTGSKLVVKASDTIRSTPLASIIDSNGKSNFFFAGPLDGSNWVQSDIAGQRAKVAVLTPGSYLGAVLHKGERYVVMNEAFHPTGLSTYRYEGSAWKVLGHI